MAKINTSVDNGSTRAANIATSKYLNKTTAKMNPASSIVNIITLSSGFLRNIIPNAPITIRAIAITETKNSILPHSNSISSSSLFKVYAIAFALIVEQMKNAAATTRANGVLITKAIMAETPNPITFRYNNLSALFLVISALNATNMTMTPIISTYILPLSSMPIEFLGYFAQND